MPRARDDEPLLAHVRAPAPARSEFREAQREDVRARDVVDAHPERRDLRRERAAGRAEEELVDEHVRAEGLVVLGREQLRDRVTVYEGRVYCDWEAVGQCAYLNGGTDGTYW